MKPIIELLAECNDFIEENPSEYGLELSVRDVKIIAAALEKQVAKKPSEKHPFKSFGSCPECGINISTRTDKNHCGNCGQKLDWSEE